MLVRQVELVGTDSSLVTWVNTDLAVVGKKLARNKSSHVWTVVKAYKIELDIDSLKQDWKVGGLS